MYSLLVKGDGWANNQGTMPTGRVFEYTSEDFIEYFSPGRVLNISRVMKWPCLFVEESSGAHDQLSQIGWITSIVPLPKGYVIQFRVNPKIDPIPNVKLALMADHLAIQDFEFARTHWALKAVDLFEVLLMNQSERTGAPKVFSLDALEQIDSNLISVMMPFDAQFDDVYKTIQTATSERTMKCLRADDIWEHDHVIQDIVSLINRSQVVVCDCSGRNPNVFYEIGIAHTLGRDVILITQNKEDIPFDLRHLRYIQYLNNDEGREKLRISLQGRIKTLVK